MRIRTRTFPALLALVLSLAATMASRPALASDDGHFDRTLTVTGAVPVEDRIIDWVAGEFTRTSPKEMLVALMLNVATPAPS